MSGQSGGIGYRTSMEDASPSGMYTENFSPDESLQLSLKRSISLSDSSKNPFAQPQFMNRDRMPSTGGWSVNSAGHGSRPRQSIAIAPDQHMPDIGMATNGQYVDFSKPFWAQESEHAMQERRKRKRSAEDELDSSLVRASFEIDAKSLAPYAGFTL